MVLSIDWWFILFLMFEVVLNLLLSILVILEIWFCGGIMSDIMLVLLFLVDFNVLINFLIFYILMFLLDSLFVIWLEGKVSKMMS